MSKKHCYEPDNLHTWSTQNKQVRLLKTCTWQPARMEHTKYTAVRTQVYIQQNHFACTDEALGRVYRWGPWPRVQTRPLPLRPWPEPSACTCDPGPEPSACTCDPRKRVHSRPPDPDVLPLFQAQSSNEFSPSGRLGNAKVRACGGKPWRWW